MEIALADLESADSLSDAGLEALVLQDRASLLYAYGRPGLSMTAASSLFLVFLVQNRHNRSGLLLWLGGMVLALVPRLLDVLVWHNRRSRGDWNGRNEILRYAAGVYAVGILWMLFPLLFFSSISPNGRVVAAVVFSAMAGGSATVLGAAPGIAISYCVMLLVPFSLLFLAQPGRETHFLGLLGLVSFVVMAATCRVSHRGTMNAIRLGRQNEILTRAARAVNTKLMSAKAALCEANQSLEAKVRERTAELHREIAEHRSVATALARLASNDPLTGLLNRTTLSERLMRRLTQAGMAGSTVTVLFLDLDRFKRINDVQGHGIGDRVLCVVAERLELVCHDSADIARWGGDEFVVVITGWSDEGDAAALAYTIRDRISCPIRIGQIEVQVGVTIGIALYPGHGASPDELIRAADFAMYSGKKDGRDQVRLFDHLLAVTFTERNFLERRLRDAVGDGTLSVHYQPIFDAKSGRCEIMEALLRWNQPGRGPISPDVFIPIAEQSGQIVAIGRFVLHEACLAAVDWPPCWPGVDPPAVSVNVSVAQILSGRLIDDVQEALNSSGLSAARLHLEITESMLATDHLRIVPVLEELHARGVHLAMDDFGTGFSSLALLKTLPISSIKIDKIFVQETGEVAGTVIQAILLIAHAMRLDVIAEGIETEQQRIMLTKLGANRLQGFLLSRPMPAAYVSDWLMSRMPSRSRYN